MTRAPGAEKPTGLLTVENTAMAGLRLEIFIDGVSVGGVVQCHLIEGWADVLRIGPDGHFMAEGNQPVIDRKHGVVTVKWLD